MKVKQMIGDAIPGRVLWVSLPEEDLRALLRVARAAKALKDIFDLPWQKDSPIWTEEEHAIFEALKEVEGML